MINIVGVQLVRVKTMADGSKRAEIDFGERVSLGDFDELLGKSLTVVIAPDAIYEDLKKLDS